MKNLRKVLAFTLALAMLLSTMTFTTFAAGKEVEALANLKLLLNTTDAEVEQELTRSVGLAMVLKALGYAQADADAKAADNKFVDMDQAAWAKGYAALAEELKISNGTSVEPKLFSPMQKLDQKSFVTFMLRALGYDADKAWAEAGALAKEAGLVAGELAEGAFKKGDAAVVMYNALLAKVQGDEKGRTLAEKLVDEKKLDKDLAVANGLMSAEPEKLMVAEVKADNLREVTVMFNGTVNKDSAEKKGNYKLKGKTIDKAVVLEDGKTVVLTLAGDTAMDNKKETKLTVSGVKNAAGVVMEKQEVMFVPFDNENPTITNVVFTGPKSLEITFSEPVKVSGAKVSLKDGKSNLTTKVTADEANERVAKVSTFTTLKDGTEYLVCVGDPKNNNSYVKDYANYPNLYFEGAYTYTADKTAPEATVVKADQKVVVVEFNKPVMGITAKHFYHSFASYTAVGVYKDEKMDKAVEKKDSVSKVWVKFYEKDGDKALPAGTVPFTILGEADNSKIQDNWKNAFASQNFNLEIVADREAPEVVSAEVTGEKEIKVTFNEDVKNISRERFTLLDKDGKEVEKGSKLNVKTDNGKKVDKVAKLTLSESYAGKTLTLTIKGIKDASLYENMMADYSTTLEFGDKTWKGVKRVELQQYGTTEDNRSFALFVVFEEKMDESATDVANYKLQKGEEIVNIKGTADFYEGQTDIVKIDLTYEKGKDKTDAHFITGNDLSTYTDDSVNLVVNNKVKDLAGNTTENFQKSYPIKKWDNTANAPKIKSIEAVETKKIVVKFDTELLNVEVENFKVKSAGDKYKELTYNPVDGKTLEIYTEKALPTGQLAEDYGIELTYKVNKATADVYGRWLEAASGPVDDVLNKPITDKIAPAVAKIVYDEENATTMSATGAYMNVATKNDKFKDAPAVIVMKDEDASATDGKDFVLKIKYTEKIDENTVSFSTYEFSQDFKLNKEPGAGRQTITVNGREVVILLTRDKVATEQQIEDLTVTQAAKIYDKANNAMASSSEAFETLNGTK